MPATSTSEPPEWKRITPEHLHPAIEHIRTEFKHGRYGWSIATQVYCRCSLHDHPDTQKLLAQNQNALETCLAAVGPSTKDQFERLIKQATQPSVFRAYFDLYYDMMRVQLLRAFDQVLRVGVANWDALRVHPVSWAHRHSTLMIRLDSSIEHWIKHACDHQELPEPDLIPPEFEEIVHWRKWRAPRLIYMQPAGNAPYDPKTVWSREDEPRTKQLLTARSKRFVEFLDLSLEKMAGAAHVAVAQDKHYSERICSEARNTRADTIETAQVPPKQAGEEQDRTRDSPIAEGAQRYAVIKKIQNPQTYATLTVPEASLYFGVCPRTIYRWLDEGRLRDGGRRGTITTESIRLWDKKRSRKRRNKTTDFS